ncbi:HelD family protein [Streptomyces sp. NPDC054796]
MPPRNPVRRDEIGREQAYVSMLYRRVDELRARTSAELAALLRESGGTAQARTERDAAHARLSGALARWEAAENGLCFGRLDLRDGSRYYIGRIGLRAALDDGRDPLLVDWRAPAARPFYVATPAAPEGVRRRRHIVTRGRRVVDLDDEVLDSALLDGDEDLSGEGVLLAAVDAGRTGRMHDVVATLQAEQDAVLRSDHRGVLVVQGGPGTGKTAVALHRAAYLLHSRPHLAARGVLVVGPSTTFLTYIGQVLPGLGETGVLLSTVGELFPGVLPDRAEPAATSALKGRVVLAEVIAAAVRQRQAPPGTGTLITRDGDALGLDRDVCERAARQARATGLPHNEARQVFVREVTGRLARRLAEQTRRLADRLEEEVADVLAEADIDRAVRGDLARLGGDPESVREAAVPDVVDEADIAAVRRELLAEPALRTALDALWPELTPRQLLSELFADPDLLARAAPGLDESERALLTRAPGGWSPADIPLLDEAAELLGVDGQAARARTARAHARESAYAQEVLDLTADAYSGDDGDTGGAGGASGTRETLTPVDVLDAGHLAARHRHTAHRTVAERAAADRTWAFGHVIVDEAQELSQMAWRLLMRRCPGRSMTLVGDMAQSAGAEGVGSWDRLLRPHVGDRWRLARLTVNYRTPAEIMDVASGLLTTLAPGTEPPRSVRRTGVPPWRLRTTSGALPTRLARLASREAWLLGEGRLAVIVPDRRTGELAAAVARSLPGASFGAHPDLTARVVVLGVAQAKGLEFDSVLVADPAGILATPHGHSDLYVALTRATQRLGVLHTGPPPVAVDRMTLRRDDEGVP